MAFNVAAGAGATAAAKVGATLLLTSFAVPAVATLVVSSLAVGAAGAAVAHALENRSLKKAGLSTHKFWSAEKKRKNVKNFFTSSGLALVGGALFLGFSEGVFEKLFGATPAPAAVPVAVPVVIPPTEQFSALINGHNVALEVKQALARAASTDAHVAAQGTKDLGYYAFNGLGGVPKDATLAVDLFKEAATAGSTQAKVDLAYIQYHGLAGVPVDKAAAIASLQDVHTAKAESFLKSWGATAKAAAVAAPKM